MACKGLKARWSREPDPYYTQSCSVRKSGTSSWLGGSSTTPACHFRRTTWSSSRVQTVIPLGSSAVTSAPCSFKWVLRWWQTTRQCFRYSRWMCPGHICHLLQTYAIYLGLHRIWRVCLGTRHKALSQERKKPQRRYNKYLPGRHQSSSGRREQELAEGLSFYSRSNAL